MDKKEVLKFAVSMGYSKIGKRHIWKGYEVYPLSVNVPKGEIAIVGYPLVAMVKNGKIRLSTPEESLEFLDFLRPKDDEE